jgi:hypothetical protein
MRKAVWDLLRNDKRAWATVIDAAVKPTTFHLHHAQRNLPATTPSGTNTTGSPSPLVPPPEPPLTRPATVLHRLNASHNLLSLSLTDHGNKISHSSLARCLNVLSGTVAWW